MIEKYEGGHMPEPARRDGVPAVVGDVWQQAVIDFAECGPEEAAMCAKGEAVVRERLPQSTWGSQAFYEAVYRQVMSWWTERQGGRL